MFQWVSGPVELQGWVRIFYIAAITKAIWEKFMPGEVYTSSDEGKLRQCAILLVDEWSRHIVAATESKFMDAYDIRRTNVLRCEALDEETPMPNRASNSATTAATAAIDDNGDELSDERSDSRFDDSEVDCDSSDART